MINDFEYVGIWWLPDNPENQFYGTLKFTRNEGAILNVIGCQNNKNLIEAFKAAFTSELTPQEIIHGFSADGKCITLYHCHSISKKNPIPGIPQQSFNVNTILVGHHFKNPDDIKFKQVSVHYSYLNEWANVSGFKRITKNENKFEDLIFGYEKPANICLTENKDYKICIDFSYAYFHPFFGKELSIKQEAFITMTFKEYTSFEKCYDLIELFQDFLTIGTMETVYPLSISGEIESDTSLNNKSIDITISSLKIPDLVEKINIPDMLFSFNDIKENINFYLKNWFNNANKIKYIYGLYFSNLYAPTYIENRFLNYIMAIEGYSRAMGHVDLPAEEHKQRIKDVLNAVGEKSDEHKNWLSGRLHHTNEPGLEKRLNIILESYQDIFGGKKEFEEFVAFVYDTRNDLVHPKGNENSTINPKKLYNNTELLKLAVEICLLTSLGFETEYIKKLLPKMQHKMFRVP